MSEIKSPVPYGRHFAVVDKHGKIMHARRTRKQADQDVGGYDDAGFLTHIVETEKPLPLDVELKYIQRQPYDIKDLQ